MIDDDQVLAALAVLLFADADVVGKALDRVEDLDVYRRDRHRLAVALLHADDEDVPGLAESLALSCDPAVRRKPFSQGGWGEGRGL